MRRVTMLLALWACAAVANAQPRDLPICAAYRGADWTRIASQGDATAMARYIANIPSGCPNVRSGLDAERARIIEDQRRRAELAQQRAREQERANIAAMQTDHARREAALARDQAQQARQRAASEADNAAFSFAQRVPSRAAYDEYLREYPTGLHVAEAHTAIAQLESDILDRQMHAGDEAARDCWDNGQSCGPRMVYVPGGAFDMGAPAADAAAKRDERPVRANLEVGPLLVGMFEVTVGEWRACASDQDRHFCSNPNAPASVDAARSSVADRPITNITWAEAHEYLDWLSERTNRRYRLLSEAEWEYAARAGGVGPYSFGAATASNICQHTNASDASAPVLWIGPLQRNTNCSDGYGDEPAPVGHYGAAGQNAWHLSDMTGNVYEWVEDCYIDSYADLPSRAAPVARRGNCPAHVLRGGAFTSPLANLRITARHQWGLADRAQGFRVARAVDPSDRPSR